ncbi:MAG: hypothetical protein ACRDNZ_03230 [Streptosporangiaceae bacterium]
MPAPGALRPDADLAAGREYVSALVSGLPSRNGWTIAEQAGDRSPAKMQRLVNRAWREEALAMSEVRRYAAAGEEAAWSFAGIHRAPDHKRLPLASRAS